MSSSPVAPPHPVTGLLARTGDHVAAMKDAWLPSLSAEETGRALVEADRLLSQITELQARLAAHADAVGTAGPSVATSTANWLATNTRQTRQTTHRLMRLLDRIPADALPKTAGVNATVVVTMTLDDLRRENAVGELDTGHRLTAHAIRRLACEAGIVPAVLNGTGEVLDLGRRQRLFSRAQRTALMIRDRGCTTDGCDWSPAMCHAHHHDPWSRGGATDLANGRLLCPRAHDPAYETRHLDGGKVAFHRRT